MVRLKLMAAGVALAATVAVSSVAEAGSKRGFHPCRTGGWRHYPAPTTRYYAPPAAPAAQVTAQPPAPAGSGVVRRYSYEPGTEAAAPVVDAPAYRPSAPTYRSAPPSRSSGGFKAGLTGADRLRPGSRNR